MMLEKVNYPKDLKELNIKEKKTVSGRIKRKNIRSCF